MSDESSINQAPDVKQNRLRSFVWRLSLGFTCWMVFFIFFILHLTYRYRYFSYDQRQLAESHHPKRSFLLALWHEHLFASLGAHSFQGISPIISQSKDGEIVSFVATKMGMTPVRGSSSRGGRQAVSSLELKIADGLSGAITLDGPRGPRRKPKLGVFHISASTSTMILPSVAVANRFWTLSSWDEFKIPKPFATIAVVYGSPIIVSDASDRHSFRIWCDDLSEAINSLETKANELLASKAKEWTPRRHVLTNAKRTHG